MHIVVALLKLATVTVAVWLTVRAFCCSPQWGLLFLALPFAYGWLRPHVGGPVASGAAATAICLFAKGHWREARLPLLAAAGMLLVLFLYARPTVRAFFP